MRVSFTIGVYQERTWRGEERWTALTPAGSEILGQGSLRLRDRLIEKVREALRKVPPAQQDLYQHSAGSELRRVSVDLEVEGGRVKGQVPLILEPRWVGEDRRVWCVYHPRRRSQWFAAPSPEEALLLAPAFLKKAWSEVPAPEAEGLLSSGKDRLTTLAFTCEPHSLLEDLPSRKQGQRAGAGGQRERVLAELGQNESEEALVEDPTLAPRPAYRERMAYLLGGQRPRSVAVVGPSGAGKTAIIRQWIRDRLVEDGYPLHRNLDKVHQVWRLSGQRLIAGMSYLGEWEERCLSLVDEARRHRLILWIEDLHRFDHLGQSRESERSFADFFRGPIRRGDLAVVAELTPEQLAHLERNAPGLAEALAIVRVAPASREETAVLMLQDLREREARSRHLRVDPAVPRLALDLGTALFPWRALPGVAMDLVRAVSVAGGPIGPQHVLEHLARTTGLPEQLLASDEPLALADIAESFGRRVMGQAVAVRAAASLVVKLRAGLGDPARPLGVMLFTGPTGTGKTELATAIAEYLYGDRSRLVRLDMGELAGPEAVARLIGDGGPGLLTDPVRAQPFCVVLLDEIEKAHPAALHLLLQVFEDARLTDARGDTVSFASAVVIMTSNLGSKSAQPIGFGESKERILGEVASAVREFFPVELFNRLDQVVPFAPLTQEVAAQVVDKELGKLLSRRGLREQSTFVHAGQAIKKRAVAQAFDARQGARSVKRWLEDQIGGALTDLLASAPASRLRIVRLGESEGQVVARLEPMVERQEQPGPYLLAEALDLPSSSLEPLITRALTAIAACRSARPARASGEVAYYVDELGSELDRLEAVLGGEPLHDDDEHELERPRGARPRSSGSRPRRDEVLAAIASALRYQRSLPHLLEPDSHAVTVLLSRIGNAADDMVYPVFDALTPDAWYDGPGMWADRKGATGEFHDVPPGAATDMVFNLHGLFVRQALEQDAGTWLLRENAAEPVVVRVDIRPGAHEVRAVLRQHLEARQALERAMDQGGALPPNPDAMLPVARTMSYRVPLRPREPYVVELEDLATGWVDRCVVPGLGDAVRRAWHLAWSRA